MELLLVVAIIAMLAALLFPVFARKREDTRRRSCQGNLRQIGIGLMQYGQDNDGGQPFVYVGCVNRGCAGTAPDNYSGYLWQDAIYPYVKSAQSFTCPSQTIGQSRSTDVQAYQYVSPSTNGQQNVRGTYAKFQGSYEINACYQRNDLTSFQTLPPVTSVQDRNETNTGGTG